MTSSNLPLFSIVTVVLNDAIGLAKTKRSIFNQQYLDYEWIIVDGGSTDGTLDVVGEHNSSFMKLISSKDNGIYDAMNHGVTMCSGKFVVFMNAGDTFHGDGTLFKVANILSEKNLMADILFGGAMLSFISSGRLFYRAPRHVKNSLWHGLPANHQATYYRKVLLDKTPYDLKYRLCGDYYLAAALVSKAANVIYFDEPLATFEVGGQSYKRRRLLFVEPYCIQRDVLGLSFYLRLASLTKRLFSTVGFILLSQSFFNKK